MRRMTQHQNGPETEKQVRLPVFWVVGTLMVLEVLPLLAIWFLQPPPPVDLNAADEEFSSARAMEHVEAIAREPHPVWSPEHQRVLDYIVGKIQGFGLEPRVQVVDGAWVPLKNIVARLEGTGTGARWMRPRRAPGTHRASPDPRGR